MNILLLNTAGRETHIGVIKGEEEILRESAFFKHSENLFPMLEEVLNLAGMKVDDFDAFAVVVGPGSFTGIRIGIAVAKGFSYIFNKPVIEISTLELLAFTKFMRSKKSPICAIINAGAGLVYHQIFEFIEGDIKGCFDNIDHGKLVGYIGNKIKDARLIKLIWKMLKAGYLEDWKYNSTYSGTPQGGIISPLFANIYLHELDKFVAQLSKNFFSQPDARRAPEYRAIEHKLYKTSKEIKIATQEERAKLIEKYKLLKKELLKTPCKKQTDKKIKYIRYADDFIMGVNGSKENCVRIKEKLSDFIACELKMEMSDEKTLITHSSECARFLGFDIRVRRNDSVKRGSKGNVTMRTLNNKTELLIPQKDKIMKFLFDKKVIQQRKSGEIVPVSRAALLRCTELEIVSQYNAELRGICNYYSIASNYNILNYFSYLMEYSCLKTLAHKLRSNCGKVKVKYKDGNGKWGIPYETKTGKKRCYLAKHSDCRNVTVASDNLPNTSKMLHGYIGTTLESRLSAKVCELCGTSEAEYYEIHHVNKVKNLKGKALWEKVMIAKRRKTIVLCKSCHDKIHNRSSHND